MYKEGRKRHKEILYTAHIAIDINQEIQNSVSTYTYIHILYTYMCIRIISYT